MCLVSIFLVMCPLSLSTCCFFVMCVLDYYISAITNLFKRFVIHFAIAIKDYDK
jgi:hypothetical protein